MNRKLYKAAYIRVLEKKYLHRHVIVFVVGNFGLFFLSLQSWTPAIYYLLTLIWIRVLAIHFTSAYPEIAKEFRFKTEKEEDKAIDKELVRIKKSQKQQKKKVLLAQKAAENLALETILDKEQSKKYNDSELV